MRNATPGWLAAAVGLVLVDRVLMAYRWLLLLRAVGHASHVPVGAVMRVFFTSNFVGAFLPASVGADAVRAYGLSRLDVPAAESLASVLVDRLLGVVSVVIMAVGGLVLAHRVIGGLALAGIAAMATAVLVAALLLLFDARAAAVVLRLIPARFHKVRGVATRVLGAIQQYGGHRGTLGVVLAASIGVQVLRTLTAWFLGLALGIPTAVVWYFAWLPVIILVMLLPITPAGLGTGQAAFQLLFGVNGVPAADALALSVLFVGLSFVGSLPGGLLYAFGPRNGGRGAA